jgi:hypothetical protein
MGKKNETIFLLPTILQKYGQRVEQKDRQAVEQKHGQRVKQKDRQDVEQKHGQRVKQEERQAVEQNKDIGLTEIQGAAEQKD